jgi:hypothetical protein
MSYFDISIENLQNSETLSNAIADNIVPKNGKNILATTTAARGYAGQTLSSSDLISAASGKDLLASGVYGNLYRISMARESLSSLSSSILGSENADLQIPSPNEVDADGNPIIKKGQDAALSIIAGSSLGRKYNDGVIADFANLLINKYQQSGDGSGHSPDNGQSSSEAVSAGYMPIALASNLNEQEIKWYIERGSILKTSAYINDSDVLTQGFQFDIQDSLLNLTYNSTTIFPGLENSGKIQQIPEDIITAKPQKAFVSAALIECLLFLAGNVGGSLKVIGGLGAFRASSQSDQAANLNELVSGGSVTDHAFGRAFDFTSISKSDESLRPISSGVETYKKHLDNLLEKLNVAPQHILPDVIIVNSFVGQEYANGKNNGTMNKVSSLYQNLKYVKIILDNNHHADHIHMSFSPQRGGKYVAKDGGLSLVVGSKDVISNPGNSSSIKPDKFGVSINTAILTKVFTDYSTMSDMEVFVLLKEAGNFSAEMAAVFTAISFRESSWRPRVVNNDSFVGLFQIGTKESWSRDLKIDLAYPFSTTVKMWQLVLADKSELTNLSGEQILNLIDSRSRSEGHAEFYAGAADEMWIPINQVRMLRSKLNQTNYTKEVVSGPSRLSCVFFAWGENFFKNSWMTSVDFQKAKSVYIKYGGDADNLKSWILQTVPKDSTAWYKFTDQEHSNKTKIEAWVNEEVKLGEQYGEWKNGVFTPTREATSSDVWLK